MFIFDLQTKVQMPDKQSLELRKGELSLGLFRDRVSSRIKIPSLEWTQGEKKIQGELELELLANESVFKIENLQFSHRNSKLDFRADFPDWKWSRGSIGLNAKVQLADIQSFAKQTSLKGELELRLGFDFQDYWPTQGSGLLRGSGLEVDAYSVGGLLASLQIERGSLKIPRMDIQHSAGQVNLENTEFDISLKPLRLQIKSQVRTPELDIHKLFQSLHIPADVSLLASAQFFCSGPLLPTPELKCDGGASAKNLRIQTNGKPFLELDPFQVKGQTLISSRDIRYQGDVLFGGGRGQSQGVIDYQNGFSIDFDTSEMLDFSAVRKLAELHLEGKALLRGHTEGDSRQASFWIDLQGQDLFFENYALGQTNGKMKYRAGILEFENLEGRLGKSFYQGQLSIDLLQERIKAEAQLKRFEASDIVRALSRFLPLPLDVTGIGNAEVSLSGPLIPSQLSYRTFINLERGSIFGESFERLEVRATSDQGRLRADSVKMRKRNSIVSLQGQAFPSGELDFFIRGEALALEDSENISRLKANVSGNLDFGLNITGTLSEPEFSVKANLTDLILEDQEFEDSNLAMQIDSRSAEGRLFLFGRRLTADFRIPWQVESDFRLTAKALDLDFAPLLSLVGSSRLLSDYSSSLSAQINLSSKSEGLKNANGGIEINQLVLQRSNLSLSNLSKIRIPFKDGRFDVN
ncbi:MAG: hypothetical protein WCH11_06185, partial [Bdellovibrio sp.]